MKPTLLVLAAGMGSRYGSLKQLDGFGPNGETIIDYSVYDAIRAGFGKIVFIVRESFKSQIQSIFSERFGDKIKLEFVSQEIHKIPIGLKYPNEREKPWGTAHAVMMGKEVINEPFGVINADDFYGRSSYETLSNFLSNDKTVNYSVVSYFLKNTLSDYGTVNRGVCSSDNNNNLTKIVECLKIARNEAGRVSYNDEHGSPHYLKDNTLVSMNMFGFKPSFFEHAESQFKEFIHSRGHELKSEFFIPLVIDNLIKENTLNVNVLTCDAEWFGVTYRKDKPHVVKRINKLIEEGVYPKTLWG